MGLEWRAGREIEQVQPLYKAFLITHEGKEAYSAGGWCGYPYTQWNSAMRNLYALAKWGRGICTNTYNHAIDVHQQNEEGYGDWLVAEALAGRLPKSEYYPQEGE